MLFYTCIFAATLVASIRSEKNCTDFGIVNDIGICQPLSSYKPNADMDSMFFRLFTEQGDNDGTKLMVHDNTGVKIDTTRQTVFLIHGWTNNEKSVWYAPTRDAYFNRSADYNIFYVDWSIDANLSYPQSAANIKPIGGFIADFIIKIGLDLNKVHLIGHSMGSHLSSFVGKAIAQKTGGQKIHRITAADPAAPMFSILPPSDRIDADDAVFVDVIHTDNDHYGITRPVGHVDFYPNSGKNMPECPPLEIDENCSHAQSTLYFIESIQGVKHMGKPAASWLDFQAGNFLPGQSVLFGQDCPITARGVYYFSTKK